MGCVLIILFLQKLKIHEKFLDDQNLRLSVLFVTIYSFPSVALIFRLENGSECDMILQI